MEKIHQGRGQPEEMREGMMNDRDVRECRGQGQTKAHTVCAGPQSQVWSLAT
jgi:hypothetical protein